MKHKINSSIKTVTMKDIAIQTGFSINTISRALKDKDDISVQTKELIADTAKKLGYIGNSLASSMRSGETGTIAVIVSDVSNPLFGIMVKEIETELRKSNYCTFVLNSDENYTREEEAIKLALSKKVDGVIICPTQSDKEDIEMLSKNGIPFVLMGRHFDDIETDCVVWDDRKGGYLATSHLIEKGHREILFLNGPDYISSARERLEGYQKALSENNLEFNNNLVQKTMVNSKNCLTVFKKLADNKVGFSAVFTFNDVLAWEAISALKKLGIRVPEDIAVVGFDNIQSKLQIPFLLTTVSTPKSLMAKKSVELILNKINGKNHKIVKHVIDTKLVLGDST